MDKVKRRSILVPLIILVLIAAVVVMWYGRSVGQPIATQATITQASVDQQKLTITGTVIPRRTTYVRIDGYTAAGVRKTLFNGPVTPPATSTAIVTLLATSMNLQGTTFVNYVRFDIWLGQKATASSPIVWSPKVTVQRPATPIGAPGPVIVTGPRATLTTASFTTATAGMITEHLDATNGLVIGEKSATLLIQDGIKVVGIKTVGNPAVIYNIAPDGATTLQIATTRAIEGLSFGGAPGARVTATLARIARDLVLFAPLIFPDFPLPPGVALKPGDTIGMTLSGRRYLITVGPDGSMTLKTGCIGWNPTITKVKGVAEAEGESVTAESERQAVADAKADCECNKYTKETGKCVATLVAPAMPEAVAMPQEYRRRGEAGDSYILSDARARSAFSSRTLTIVDADCFCDP